MGGNTSSQVADPASANFVNEQVSNNCVLIFSKTYCPYCRSVKQLFQNLGVTPAVIELDKMQDGPSIQAVLGQMTGATTVPRVFVNGKCIGGNSETQSLNQSGKLQQLLQECTNAT